MYFVTQFLNRSVAHSANVVDVLAAFGLGYTIVKVLVGVLGEVRHAGLVLVHDQNGNQNCTEITSLSIHEMLIFDSLQEDAFIYHYSWIAVKCCSHYYW